MYPDAIKVGLNFEALPMGFETRTMKPMVKKLHYFEALPMGFETVALLLHCRLSCILKHSLWDLKQDNL